MLLSLATFPHATVQAKKQNTIEHICEQTTKQRSCCLQLNMWLASHSHSDIPWRVVSFVSLQQIMWQRLFQGTSSAESGTIFQIFQRNIHKDVAKHMNATEDLFETTVNYYIIAAAMHFFAMWSTYDTPQANALPEDIVHRSIPEHTKCLWDKVAQLVDRYVLLSDLSKNQPKEQNQTQGIPKVCNLKKAAQRAHVGQAFRQTPCEWQAATVSHEWSSQLFIFSSKW